MLTPLDEIVAALRKLLSRSQRGLLETLSLGELSRKLAGPASDHGQSRIEKQTHLDQLIGAALVGEDEQRRTPRHGGEPGEKRRNRLLLGSERLPMSGDIGGCQRQPDIGRADPRLGSVDCLRCRLLLGMQPFRVILRFRSSRLELCGLCFSGRLLRNCGLERRVESSPPP